ncbi:hypothetical protein Q8F55_003014 [Vanrija albida]|uniref:Uncharacterized protein n=1 Tax=Vanrija albida TaxID=181172 RepID=A0ABR3QBI1_9TREE
MSTAKSYTSELERALRTQDPHDRIMFEPPMRFAAFGGMMTLRVLDVSHLWRVYTDVQLKAVRVTAHLLPFYNIAMISHLRWFGYNAATGRRPHGSNQLATRTSYTSLEGCTVAAVPRDHWAL